MSSLKSNHSITNSYVSAARCCADHSTWRDYVAHPDSAQYSSLAQITRSNVSKLQVAWTFPTGDNNKYFFNPVVVDGVMYVLAKSNSIVALDAATARRSGPMRLNRTRLSSPPAGSIIGE